MTLQGAEHMAMADASRALPLRVMTLAQMSPHGAWQSNLPHSRPDHVVLWITRGQGRATIRGLRRGIGTNNVLYLPPHTQFALETGPQCFGQALIVEDGDLPLLPQSAQHLRIRDVTAQGELSSIVEMIQREQQHLRPLQSEALVAKFNLAAVWLRRMMLLMLEEGDRVSPAMQGKETAGQRLSRAFADLLERDFRSGKSMAEYAEALDVTPTHLTRVARDHAGMTAADLITQRVLHEARLLLIQPHPPVQNIANYLGFGSAAYFSRFIQNHTGHSPTALRAAAQPGDKSASQSSGARPVFRHSRDPR